MHFWFSVVQGGTVRMIIRTSEWDPGELIVEKLAFVLILPLAVSGTRTKLRTLACIKMALDWDGLSGLVQFQYFII